MGDGGVVTILSDGIWVSLASWWWASLSGENFDWFPFSRFCVV